MNFYKLSIPVGGTKHPYASRFGPIPEMPFWESYPESFVKGRKEFWNLAPRPPGMTVAPGGRSWGDFIGHGGGSPFYFVGGRVIDDLREAGIGVLRTTRMPIAEIEGKTMRKIPPPDYFVVEAPPGISIHWQAMGLPTTGDNRLDLSQGYPKPWPPAEWLLDASTWNGKDLMSYQNFQYWTTLICTERVKQLAGQNGWTNCAFDLLKVVPG